jgi:hypothetical protein
MDCDGSVWRRLNMPLVSASPAFIHFQWSRRKSGPQTNLQCDGRSGAFPGQLRPAKKGRFMPFRIVRVKPGPAPVAAGRDPVGPAQQPFVPHNPDRPVVPHNINNINIIIEKRRPTSPAQTQHSGEIPLRTAKLPAGPHQTSPGHQTHHARTQPKPKPQLKPEPTAHGAPPPAPDPALEPHGRIHTLAPLMNFRLRE